MTDRQQLSRTESGLLLTLDRQGQFGTVDRVSIRRRLEIDETSTFPNNPIDEVRCQDDPIFPRWFVLPLEATEDWTPSESDDADLKTAPNKRTYIPYWIVRWLILPVILAMLFVGYLVIRSAAITSIKTETDPAHFELKCSLLDFEARVIGDDPTRAMLVRQGCKGVEAPTSNSSQPARGPANPHTNVFPDEPDRDHLPQ
jgi:hypothetical protein